jgi:hypothetical protein
MTMKNYLIIVAGGQHNVTANSKEDAVNKLPADERPWVLEVVEL